MFQELTDHWNSLGISGFTRSIHPIWEARSLRRNMICKRANSYYHRYAIGRGPCNDLLYKWNNCDSPLCRLGYGITETTQHIFIDSIHNQALRIELLSITRELGLDYKLKGIFGDLRCKTAVEKFILTFHGLNRFQR